MVATTIERDAVLDGFSESHQCTADIVYAPRRAYFKIGGIQDTNIFLVQCEMGSGGGGASQAVVRDAIDDLDPKNIVMVGIAFGMRPDEQEIGTVLVSKQLHCYEMQRVGTKGVKAVCTLRGDRVTASAKLLSKFRASQYRWGGPVAFGLILSGEKLIDNESFRRSLAGQSPEVLGGEMEGAGLYAAASDLGKDWIIVKAVCDWADGNKAHPKKDEFQKKAAGRAADFVIFTISQGAFARHTMRARGSRGELRCLQRAQRSDDR